MKRIAIYLCLFACLASSDVLAETQTGITSRGLDRVDQRTRNNGVTPYTCASTNPGVDSTYTYDYSGQNTIIYIVDKGVAEVSDLAGRILAHRTQPFANPDVEYSLTSSINEHGTKAASIAAGTTYGVAKGAWIVDMRIWSYDKNAGTQQYFSSSACINPQTGESVDCAVLAFSDIISFHQQRCASCKGVVNYSADFGTSASPEFEAAITNLVANGFTVVVSATEWGTSACSHTPAKLGAAYNGLITVSGVESDDRLAVDESRPGNIAGSGSCVDIFAPTSTLAANYNNSPDVFQHTSSAAPFVSGAAALVYSQNPWMWPGDVENLLKENATRNLLCNIPAGTVNALLYTRLPDVTLSMPSAGPQQNVSASVTPIAGATYLWSVENGMILGPNNASTVNFKTGCPTETKVKVTITTTDGYSYSGYATIRVTAANARVSGSASINAGQSATLNITFTGTGPWTVLWSDGYQQTYTTNSATRTVTPTQTKTYSASNVVDGYGCNGTKSGSATVTVCPVSTTITAPASGKASAAINVSVAQTTGATYRWTVTNGEIWNGTTSATPTIILGCSGVTTVTVTVTTTCGQQTSASKSIAITVPNAVVWNNSTIPAGETAIVGASFSGTPPFSITFSDGTRITSINSYTYYYYVTPSVTTTYTATAMSSKYGCAGTTSGSATVTVE